MRRTQNCSEPLRSLINGTLRKRLLSSLTLVALTEIYNKLFSRSCFILFKFSPSIYTKILRSRQKPKLYSGTWKASITYNWQDKEWGWYTSYYSLGHKRIRFGFLTLLTLKLSLKSRQLTWCLAKLNQRHRSVTLFPFWVQNSDGFWSMFQWNPSLLLRFQSRKSMCEVGEETAVPEFTKGPGLQTICSTHCLFTSL